MTKRAVDGARALVEADGGTGPLLVRDDLGARARRARRRPARRQPRPPGGRRDPRRRGGPRLGARASDFHVAAAPRGCAEFSRSAAAMRRRGVQPAARVMGGVLGRFGALSRPFPLTRPRRRSGRAGSSSTSCCPRASTGPWPTSSAPRALRPGHVEPVVAVTGMVLTEARRVGAASSTSRSGCVEGLETFDAIAFGRAERPLPEPVTRSTSSARSSATTSTACRAFGFGSSTSPTRRRARCWRAGCRRSWREG